MFAVIDIETTGLSPKNEKITEIAVFIFDGKKITDKFVTLINPERYIPYHITRLTGITNEMIKNAPCFYEVARKIAELTENRIFVAHNALFDYNFVKNEFKLLGYDYSRETLCTVKLSRKVFPGFKSYSLGQLCKYLRIETGNMHRAESDACATVMILEKLLDSGIPQKQFLNANEKYKISDGLHPELEVEELKKLPQEHGVYYLYNEKGNIIYIGKSCNIKERVFSHLRNKATRRAAEMAASVKSVGYELCGNELISGVLESEEIKKNRPLYNRAGRRNSFAYSIDLATDENGYNRLSIEKTNKSLFPVITFHTPAEAMRYLEYAVEKYNLCQKLCGIYKTSGPCFYRQISRCLGACVGIESADEYNKRVSRFVDSCNLKEADCLIIGKGRYENEFSALKIARGLYSGYGFFTNDSEFTSPEQISEMIKNRTENRDIRLFIINHLLRKGNEYKVIHLRKN